MSSMWYTAIALVVLLTGSSVHAQSLAERLDPLLNKAVEEQHIPGLAIGIVQNGQLVYARGFGVMEMGKTARPVTTQTLFHMASITKPFVATSLMQLWEQRKVDLDAPVKRYVPYFQLRDVRAAAITVRQMLTHTSGMPDVSGYEWNKPQYDDGALERYVRSLSDRKLLWDPGTKFAYSNMAYEVLGDLVAKVSGQSFEDYVEAHILQPLAMISSTLLLRKADADKLAAGHTKGTLGSMKAVKHYPYNRAHTPSSNLHSNIDDMARWAMANLNRGELDGHRILQDSTYDVMWKQYAQRGETAGVGISWFLAEVQGQKAVIHNGGDDGFVTRLVLFPNRRSAVVYMLNCDVCKPGAFDGAVRDAALGQ
jgi:CubicO group peptidase (beta-lactamase class C family)